MDDEEFLGIFRDEANERLDNIVDTLLQLERGDAGEDALNVLFRDAHTIKGGAGMLQLDDVRSLAHAFEDVLAHARESGVLPPELVDPLLRTADALRAQVAGDTDPATDVLDELKEIRASLEGKASPPAANGSAPRSPQSAAPASRTVRVPTEKVDRLLDLVGETVLHRRRLEYGLGDRLEEQSVNDELDVGGRLFDELKDAAIQMRTLPLATIIGHLPRAVRDIASASGKEVDLVVGGAETELDRVILESLSEPLAHVLRNAVAHGIETPPERRQAGKVEIGRVELHAEQRGRLVEITVRDDGRGVPREVLAEAGREGSLTDVLTRPGYSTADEVTEFAGRGVGLDAVRAHVETYGGQLEIESEPGRGTVVVLRLPLALALLDVLLVERGDAPFAIPLASVAEVVAVEDTHALEEQPVLVLRERTLPVFDLAELLGADAPPFAQTPPAVVISSGGRRVAVMCDRLLGEEEVVVKPLGELLAGLRRYLGASILGDGRIALVLDPLHLAVGPGHAARSRSVALVQDAVPDPGKVLVVEDSFTVRELQRSILEAAGYRVETARDGREALERLDRDPEIGLLLTDVEMPEMDGLELTRAVRADPERSELPIMIVTTRGSDEDRRQGLEAGADAYMAKRSFDQQALLESVGRLLAR